MNIVWIVDKQFDFSPDRVTWIEFIKHLQTNNNVYLITGYKKNKVQFDELYKDIIYIDSLNIPFLNRFVFYFSQIMNFKKFILTYKPEILIFNSNNFFLLKKALDYKKKYRYKIFFDVRTLPVSSANFRNSIDNYLFKNSIQIASRDFDGVTYITKEMENYCREEFNLPEHKYTVWTSGFNREIFNPLKYKNIDKDNDRFQLFHHGGLAVSRGILELIKATKILYDEGYSVELKLVGYIEGKKVFINFINQNKMKEYCFIEEPVPHSDIPELISKADLPVIPFPDLIGWKTSSPLKLMEYLAMGKSVVVTDIEAHRNVIGEKGFAFYAKSEKAEDLVDAIKEAYKDKKYLSDYGKEGRELALENYSWEKQAEKLLRFLAGSDGF